MIYTKDVDGLTDAQQMVAGMPPKTHRMVRVRGYKFNVSQTLKEIQSLPEVDTAIVGVHTNEYVSFHIVTK